MVRGRVQTWETPERGQERVREQNSPNSRNLFCTGATPFFALVQNAFRSLGPKDLRHPLPSTSGIVHHLRALSHRGRKKHINFFNINLLAPTQTAPFWAPRKKFMCLIPGKERKKGTHINLFEGFWGSKTGVPNGPLPATKTVVYCFFFVPALFPESGIANLARICNLSFHLLLRVEGMKVSRQQGATS